MYSTLLRIAPLDFPYSLADFLELTRTFYTKSFFYFIESCEPYSQLACYAATLSMSFEIGTISNSENEFTGDYETKGCYAYLSGNYKGLSFHGTGGTLEQMQQSLQNPKWRPKGYDCNGEQYFKFKS